jgi:transcriptional regulator with PAS, ATPase and Fis domain
MARTRSNINALSRLLGGCDVPVYALDQRRRIVYGNAACFAWLGLEPRQLVGKTCDYHSPPAHELDQFAPNYLCPPPETFSGHPRSGEIAWTGSDGTLVRRIARFVPLGFPDETSTCPVMVFVDGQDVPERESRRAGSLRSEDLHAALRDMLGGMGQRFGLDQVVGDHPAIARAREVIRLAAATDSRTLVIGPPGSGREYIARAVHFGGGLRDSAPLAPLACNLLDAELLDETIASFVASCAELQIERPATLLLLEVDQLPADAQRALAGILSIRELNLRTVATSRRRLIELASENRFREDLAFSLSTLEIAIPPLSQRRDDIPLLAQFFLERRNATGGKQLSGFASDAIERLIAYDWPGNIDELAELVSAACNRAQGSQVTVADLPQRLELAAQAAARPSAGREPIQLDLFLEEVEQELLRRALERAKGNKAKAARLLGVTRSRVVRRLEHFGLASSEPKSMFEEPGC